jgi:hypothetical protein
VHRSPLRITIDAVHRLRSDDILSGTGETEWLERSLSAVSDVGRCVSFPFSDPNTFFTDAAFSSSATTTDGIFMDSSGLDEATVGVVSG